MPTLAELNRRYAQHVLTMVGGNKSEAARLLEVDRKTLSRLVEPQDRGGEPEAEGTPAESAPTRTSSS
jgi:DNA-binding NtrC family response regulator